MNNMENCHHILCLCIIQNRHITLLVLSHAGMQCITDKATYYGSRMPFLFVSIKEDTNRLLFNIIRIIWIVSSRVNILFYMEMHSLVLQK